MRVCLFGSYRKSSNGIPSNGTGDLIKEICEQQGFETTQCHEASPFRGSAAKAYARLFLKHRKMDYDVMIIPTGNMTTLPLAKMIHRRPMVYFPTLSFYDTLVNARKKIRPDSLLAKIVRFVDKAACSWADLVVLESTFQIEYFVREFGLPRGKFRQLWLAAYEPFFTPLPFKEGTGEFVVLYFGTFIPATGVETIVRAANLLRDREDVRFVLCGNGQMYPEVTRYAEEHRIPNIRFAGKVKFPSLIRHIKGSDVCLGLFSTSDKSMGAMPNKISQALASAKPLITMDTPTTREAGLEDGENCLLTRSDSPEELAECILRLRDDDALRRRVAMHGNRTYRERLSTGVAGKMLGQHIREVCEKQKTGRFRRDRLDVRLWASVLCFLVILLLPKYRHVLRGVDHNGNP